MRGGEIIELIFQQRHTKYMLIQKKKSKNIYFGDKFYVISQLIQMTNYCCTPENDAVYQLYSN